MESEHNYSKNCIYECVCFKLNPFIIQCTNVNTKLC